MKRLLLTRLAYAIATLVLMGSVPGFALGIDPAFPGPALGPTAAKGVVVWSHGRSINAEDSESPTPAYLSVLRDDGWDVLRFDRSSQGDTLIDSTQRLVEHVATLKRDGYKRIVLAGQSFGAFLALMAADQSDTVDAVIATAPAAFGSFNDFYDSWHLNATRLYPLLDEVKRARVMVFYFHDDDFDPGGRGEHSRSILSRHGFGYAVVDQPAYLAGHWAASSGLFVRRFAGCIRDFIDDDRLAGEFQCTPRWGSRPSAEMKLPPELVDPRSSQDAAATPASAGSGNPASENAPIAVRDSWYGFYPNGRELVLAVERAQGNRLSAVYAIGPSIDNKHPATWSRRRGRVVDNGFIFEEKGKSTLRFRPRPDGGLSATWVSIDGKTSMTAHLKPIDPRSLVP